MVRSAGNATGREGALAASGLSRANLRVVRPRRRPRPRMQRSGIEYDDEDEKASRNPTRHGTGVWGGARFYSPSRGRASGVEIEPPGPSSLKKTTTSPTFIVPAAKSLAWPA